MANEKRLISLDDALAATHKEVFWTESKAADVRAFLIQQPKVDAVEVVRCKYCKYRYFNKAHDKYLCSNRNGLTSRLDDGFFCSYGERNVE